MSYFRFGAMIATSTVVMFVLMYLNTYAWEHVFYSETRTYMAFLMGATMAAIMLAFMLGMYTNTKANIAIFVGAVVVFALSLWLVRSQATVSGVSYMRAMIPHHSIAIMTSERAQITDPRVRKLADEIIEAQRREIAEMRYLIADISGAGGVERPETMDEPLPEVVPAEEAVESPVVAAMDPAPLQDADVEKVLGAGAACRFHRSAEADPILVAVPGQGGARGVMKLNGKLVELASETGGLDGFANGTMLSAGPIHMRVMPVAGAETETEGDMASRKADLVFQLDQGLTVGYRGLLNCEV
ncbi:DUF305 domain-containing protein [Acuticoccus sediminis]|uniref:DUF305 domain-containing protein n=1 Tax=Acuticoccus sediminis TaxID=2184697 RepID=A0A8B2NNS2_9HYPH|nr:DUF6692 family protein [Acuticoccus sediminis]RAH96221.1 DUF305 domain-containing protein [Acuticoccus sediminis]